MWFFRAYRCLKGFFGGGYISGRDFCPSKLVRLVIGRDFASENAAPDGMWVQDG